MDILNITDNITINTHSSIRLNLGKIIYIDPFEIKSVVHDADIILVTHEHYDHFDINSIEKIIKEDTILVFPMSMKNKIAGSGFKNLIFLNPYDKYENIEAVPAYNAHKNFHKKEYDWLGYIIDYNGIKIYIAGDTDENPDTIKIRTDIAIIPIGGTYTFDPVEAANYINKIKPKIVIPSHYGSVVGDMNCFEDFYKKVDKDIEVVRKI